MSYHIMQLKPCKTKVRHGNRLEDKLIMKEKGFDINSYMMMTMIRAICKYYYKEGKT